MKAHPYIGVTGFTSREQIFAARAAFGFLAPSRLFMVGVLQSHKSIAGIPLNPPWDKRTPSLDVLGDLFEHDWRMLNMVHYASGDATPDEVLEDLKLLAQTAGLCLDGFQMNGPLPDPAL